jgi:hypothetical protein
MHDPGYELLIANFSVIEPHRMRRTQEFRSRLYPTTRTCMACVAQCQRNLLSVRSTPSTRLWRSPVLCGGLAATWVSSWVWVAHVGLMVFLALLFPDGQLPSRRWRPLARIVVSVVLIGTIAMALSPGPIDGLYHLSRGEITVVDASFVRGRPRTSRRPRPCHRRLQRRRCETSTRLRRWRASRPRSPTGSP